MKFIQVVSILCLAAAAVQGQAPGRRCANPIVRKEIRQLTQGERDAFFNAVKTLQSQGQFDKFPADHLQNSPTIHGNAIFLPWHRRYILEFERALRRINPSVTLPYWDWTMDSQDPAASQVLTGNFVGGNGEGDSKCVATGPFARYNMNVPNRHCLRRDFNRGNSISSWWPVESMRVMTNDAQSYRDLREGLEFGQHGNVHLGVRGDMEAMYAPNDPIFFLHHAMCDKVWSVWQLQDPTNRVYMYDGEDHQGRSVTLDDTLPALPGRVGDMMDQYSQNVCYEYTTSLYDQGMRATAPQPSRNVNNDNSPPPRDAQTGNGNQQVTPQRGNRQQEQQREDDDGFLSDDDSFDFAPVRRRSYRVTAPGDNGPSYNTDEAKPQSPKHPRKGGKHRKAKLSPPERLPESWIKMNCLNATRVRSFEDRHFSIIEAINNLEDYVPMVFRSVTDAIEPIIDGTGLLADSLLDGLLGHSHSSKDRLSSADGFPTYQK
ncbi:hypothetical protein IWQ60_004310 [Tieghemiomyces parasiticus]|uniref:Tyrosinase copper-binding domain-containing protein n=1 Tax=Tieghemiomyces parasiticus TaxID=78921 RepID=A0A9W8ADV8_9FUNG|nr:hypothetical protein IWQ60_004310 [Tieghemiomyces parasiticus]